MGSAKRNLGITIFSAILCGILLIFVLTRTENNENKRKISLFIFALSFYATLVILLLLFGCLKFFCLFENVEDEIETVTQARIHYKGESDKPPSYSEVTEAEKPPPYSSSMRNVPHVVNGTLQSSLRKALTLKKSNSFYIRRGLQNRRVSRLSASNQNTDRQPILSSELNSHLLPSSLAVEQGKHVKLKRFTSSPGP